MLEAAHNAVRLFPGLHKQKRAGMVGRYSQPPCPVRIRVQWQHQEKVNTAMCTKVSTAPGAKVDSLVHTTTPLLLKFFIKMTARTHRRHYYAAFAYYMAR